VTSPAPGAIRVALSWDEYQATAGAPLRPQALAELGWSLWVRGWRPVAPALRCRRDHHRVLRWAGAGKPPCPGRVAMLLALAALGGKARPPVPRTAVPALVTVRLSAAPGPLARERIAIALARGVGAADYHPGPPGPVRFSVRLAGPTRRALAAVIAEHGGTVAGWVRSVLAPLPAALGPMTPAERRAQRAHLGWLPPHDRLTDRRWELAAGGCPRPENEARLARWLATRSRS
jgi:hypothetical protein